MGAVTAGAFNFVGHSEFATNLYNRIGNAATRIVKTVAHGLVGGLSSAVQGGKFVSGFLSSGVTQAFAPQISRLDSGTIGISPTRIAAAATLGGASSVLGGGKFANGALTGAFSRAFNDEGDKSRLDRAGTERPATGFVIGPTGYWQNQTGAEVELMYGSNAQFGLAPVPSNLPSCNSLCVSIATTETFITGNSVSESLDGVTDVLIQHPNQGVSAAGHAVRRYILAYKIFDTAKQVENIKSYCKELCSLDPIEYQHRFGAR